MGKLGLNNVEVIVADISTFEMEGSYDRIISIGMFEHMKNYKFLLKKISSWMKADGFLFVHFFCHKTYAYHFEDDNEDDWITKYFFSGGTMPSTNLLLYFQDDVVVVDHGLVNGKHYAQTCEEWLKKMDKNINATKPIMESTYGKASAVKWIAYWRTFFISIAELFSYNNGEEWMDTHYLFKKNKRSWNEAHVGHVSLKTDSPSISQGTTFKAVVQPDLTNLPEISRKQSNDSDRKDCWNLVAMELRFFVVFKRMRQ
ncbi:(S)-coclaurine N-methyltransferase-like protein [Tanacetum coccineum]|uniref:(S)-coclaurine N-methyltransferase-like protein n=1 Tax=Tanacetum coccineum TaxID=301880 RepID=A0ABQ5AFI1_9ASTR